MGFSCHFDETDKNLEEKYSKIDKKREMFLCAK
jgi:hypothetical protein